MARGRGGDALDRGARPRRSAAPTAPCMRGGQILRGLPRAPRADVAVGVPGGTARARPRLWLRLAGLPRDPARVAAVARRVRLRAARARAVARRPLRARARARRPV